MRVRASPNSIEFLHQKRPNIHIEAISDGEYSIKENGLDDQQLIAFMKSHGMNIEQQDTLLIIKDALPTPPPKLEPPKASGLDQTQVAADDSSKTSEPPKAAADDSSKTSEPPKAAVYEHLDQAFVNIINGLLAPKIAVLEAKVAEATKSVKALLDRYDVFKTQIDASVLNITRIVDDANKKGTTADEKIKTDIDAKIAQLKTDIESEIVTVDDGLKKVETELKQFVATQETSTNTLTVASKNNLEEHKKLQENLNRMAQHIRDIPLPS